MYKSIVVGTDGSPTAAQAMQVAAGLARGFGSTLHVVTGYSASPSGMAAASGFVFVDEGVGFQAQHDAAVHIVSEARDQHCAGVEAQVHTVAGTAADAIVEVAEEVGADLIVVGSKGMTGARRILGSVPNSVAHGAPCAVLIVKTA